MIVGNRISCEKFALYIDSPPFVGYKTMANLVGDREKRKIQLKEISWKGKEKQCLFLTYLSNLKFFS